MINADLAPPSATEVVATANPEEEADEDDDWTIVFLPVGGVLIILVVGYLIAKGDVCYCRRCWC